MARYAARRDPIWRVPLLIIRASDKRSYAEIADDRVTLQFGSFGREVPFADIAGVEPIKWSWLYGIGLRLAPEQTLGLVGSTKGVVAIELKQATKMKVFPLNPLIKRLAISLEDPEAFVSDLSSRL